jgi:hypothetical protein
MRNIINDNRLKDFKLLVILRRIKEMFIARCRKRRAYKEV